MWSWAQLAWLDAWNHRLGYMCTVTLNTTRFDMVTSIPCHQTNRCRAPPVKVLDMRVPFAAVLAASLYALTGEVQCQHVNCTIMIAVLWHVSHASSRHCVCNIDSIKHACIKYA